MKRFVFLFCLSSLAIMFSFINCLQAQINIQMGPEVTPGDMVETIVGKGVQYDNVTFQGADVSRGIFTNADSTNLGMNSGIFLTSGSGANIPGPNNSTSTGTNNGTPGHPSLNFITIGTTYDAAVLEFDFIAETDTLSFRYVFGSEEYENWSGTAYTDVFGFFISGPDPSGGYYADENIAIDPGDIYPYFQDNTGGLWLEYDGITVVLTASIPVVPNTDYHLKLGVADVGDGIYDSGVFIEENSIHRPLITYEVQLEPPGLEETLYEEVVGADVVFRLPAPAEEPFTLEFDVAGTADPAAWPDGDFEEEIPGSVLFEEGMDSALISVFPVHDGLVEGEETLVFIFEDTLGFAPIMDTVELIIHDYFNMNVQISPNTIICQGQEVSLWAAVVYGYPPYSFVWEPGGFTSDTIVVSPDTTTTYVVQVADYMDTVTDSVKVHVFPNNFNVLSYSFEMANNTQLPWDVTGTLFEDSIALVVPEGTDVTNLIASFTLEEEAFATVNNVTQSSGVTPNDFSAPLVYHVTGMPSGCTKDWTVAVQIVTGIEETIHRNVEIYPIPASETVHILNAAGADLKLVDDMGKTCLSAKIAQDDQSLDVAKLPTGLYFLQIDLDDERIVRKLVIQR